jgi:hypothetical protein
VTTTDGTAFEEVESRELDVYHSILIRLCRDIPFDTVLFLHFAYTGEQILQNVKFD